MSGYELGSRVGISQPRVSQLERAEREGTIELRTLGRVARGLQCRLTYALVPDESLDEIVRRQAHQRATRELAACSSAAQLLLGEAAARAGDGNDDAYITVLAHHLTDRPGLWRDPTGRSLPSYQA